NFALQMRTGTNYVLTRVFHEVYNTDPEYTILILMVIDTRGRLVTVAPTPALTLVANPNSTRRHPMVMSHGKTFMTVLSLLGMVASLNWPAVVQAGGSGECCRDLLVRGTVPGGRFTGTLEITGLAVENGQLLASGNLQGT